MSIAILLHFLYTQHVSDINISIIRSCDCAVGLPQRSFCSRFVVCWRFGACNTDTTQTQRHQISKTQRTENKTTVVVIQQHSHKLLMMDILMSETC